MSGETSAPRETRGYRATGSPSGKRGHTLARNCGGAGTNGDSERGYAWRLEPWRESPRKLLGAGGPLGAAITLDSKMS